MQCAEREEKAESCRFESCSWHCGSLLVTLYGVDTGRPVPTSTATLVEQVVPQSFPPATTHGALLVLLLQGPFAHVFVRVAQVRAIACA